MLFTTQQIAKILNCKSHISNSNNIIKYLLTDSRRLSFPSESLFFALTTELRDGHQFINELYKQGVRNFVVDKNYVNHNLQDVNFLFVENTTKALQDLVAEGRKSFAGDVIGITGSNGKTIVKEWLNQLLEDNFKIVRNPRSYNSQIGVPLSVWQLNKDANLGIFEAGISRPNEMENLAKIIQPTIGVFTNIGTAHDDGFVSKEQKIEEKLKLFKDSKVIIANADDPLLKNQITKHGKASIFWIGHSQDCQLQIVSIRSAEQQTNISFSFENNNYSTIIPFTDQASIEDAIICLATCLYLQIPVAQITERMQNLRSIDMRLQLKGGINGCTIINDSYSFDITSLSIAVDFLNQQQVKHSIILSDLANNKVEDYQSVAELVKQKKIAKVITIGMDWMQHRNLLQKEDLAVLQFESTDSFIHKVNTIPLHHEAILLKGGRRFHFERIAEVLIEKVHQTRLEINLNAMAHNLQYYRQYIKPGTKLMAMVKASGYGSGSIEVSLLSQFYHVDYLAVAYADEGVALRDAGVQLPIEVMNFDTAAFEAIVEHHLEPNIFSFAIYDAFHQFLKQQGLKQYPIHLKMDTGMHRLGFYKEELPQLMKLLTTEDTMQVKSVFSHFVASEDPNEDKFTNHQANLFSEMTDYIATQLPYHFIKHIANSSAIFRFPQFHFDMVRLGIGLYGVDSASLKQAQLENVSTLITSIAQIHKIKAGETVGYNRRGKVTRDSTIATIRIGYADGFNRKLGYGNAKVFIQGKFAPTIGSICMDMAMIDITDIPEAKEGDSVEIFGSHIPVSDLAKWIGTIPYEILTGISQRIPRIYIEE